MFAIDCTWYVHSPGVHTPSHMLPNEDVQQHYLENCPCCPDYNWQGGIYVHNSFDGREAYETKRRKRH